MPTLLYKTSIALSLLLVAAALGAPHALAQEATPPPAMQSVSPSPYGESNALPQSTTGVALGIAFIFAAIGTLLLKQHSLERLLAHRSLQRHAQASNAEAAA